MPHPHPCCRCVDFCESPAVQDSIQSGSWYLTNALAGTCTADADCGANRVCNTNVPSG